jgi:hypothetical protein
MMYANLRDANGHSLGTVAVDPTAPGGMRNQLADAVAKLQQGRPLPTAAMPLQPGILPPGGYPGPLQPVSQSMPFVCHLRYLAKLPNGQTQWVSRAIPCPQGLPPGVYIHAPGFRG